MTLDGKNDKKSVQLIIDSLGTAVSIVKFGLNHDETNEIQSAFRGLIVDGRTFYSLATRLVHWL